MGSFKSATKEQRQIITRKQPTNITMLLHKTIVDRQSEFFWALCNKSCKSIGSQKTTTNATGLNMDRLKPYKHYLIPFMSHSQGFNIPIMHKYINPFASSSFRSTTWVVSFIQFFLATLSLDRCTMKGA